MRSASSMVIVTHANPDGDALGSVAALTRAAIAAGKNATIVTYGETPLRYRFLLEGLSPANTEQFASLAAEADAIVLVDTCAFSQLEPIADKLDAVREKTIVLDHHATGDDIGAVRWVDTSAAAAGVMVGELIEALAWPIDLPTAEALVMAIAADTGWMRFSNTDGRCLRAVARWLDMGVRPDELYRRVYESDRVERVRLAGRMLASLELFCDGAVAAMTILRSDFTETGAGEDETENLVNEAMKIAGVEAVVLVVEQADVVRASLRSRGRVNVAEIAGRFGGGGHVRAAGCKGRVAADSFRDQLVKACAEALAASEQ